MKNKTCFGRKSEAGFLFEGIKGIKGDGDQFLIKGDGDQFLTGGS
jgi:hypothetical protein